MISAILPSMGRAQQCAKCVGMFLETAAHDEVPIEVIVIAEEQEAYSQVLFDVDLAVGQAIHLIPRDGSAVRKWNIGACMARYDWLVLGADDLWPRAGWARALKENQSTGFVGFNDLHTPPSRATHYAVTKGFCREVLGGVFCPPMYRSWGFDVEVCDRAKAAGRYKWLVDAILEHRHWVWGGPEKGGSARDATYDSARPYHAADLAMYAARAQMGFPVDYPGFL